MTSIVLQCLIYESLPPITAAGDDKSLARPYRPFCDQHELTRMLIMVSFDARDSEGIAISSNAPHFRAI